ncbi:unnamed protein product [Amoebophrya sp. A120]|nr:unnamed protein product [Amoebophrya sp. A120]|eukprot:GSA120T00013032001.1
MAAYSFSFVASRTVLFLACIIAVGSRAGAASDLPVDSPAHKLLEVTAEGLDAVVKADQPYFLMLHVNWCGICKRTFPHFQKAAELPPARNGSKNTQQDKLEEVTFLHADCTDDKTLPRLFQVQGYPAIYYRDEIEMQGAAGASNTTSNATTTTTINWRPYSGPRTAEAFRAFADRMTRRPLVRDLKSENDLFDYHGKNPTGGVDSTTEHESWFVYVGPKPVPLQFERVARDLRDRHQFARVAQNEKNRWMPEPGFYSMAGMQNLYKNVYRMRGMYSDAISSRKPDNVPLQDWVAVNKYPGVWNVTNEFFAQFVRAGRPVLLYVLPEAKFEDERTIVAARRLGEVFRESGVLLGVLNGNEFAKSLAPMNIFEADLPRLWLITDNFNSWYEDKDLFTLDQLVSALPVQEKGSNRSADLFDFLDKRWPFVMKQDRNRLSTIWFHLREVLRICGVYQELAQYYSYDDGELDLMANMKMDSGFPKKKRKQGPKPGFPVVSFTIAMFLVAFALAVVLVVFGFLLKQTIKALFEDDEVVHSTTAFDRMKKAQ